MLCSDQVGIVHHFELVQFQKSKMHLFQIQMKIGCQQHLKKAFSFPQGWESILKNVKI